jgi:hypothetical protein
MFSGLLDLDTLSSLDNMSIQQQKTETHHTCLMVGGDHLDYQGVISTPTEKLANSTISTPNAHYFMGIKSSLSTLILPRSAVSTCTCPLPFCISIEIINQYHLQDPITNNGWVYSQICKGMYGSKQAEKLANIHLKTQHAKCSYFPTIPCTPSPLWKYKGSRDLIFCLVVNNLGIQYVGKGHAASLVQALQDIYIK